MLILAAGALTVLYPYDANAQLLFCCELKEKRLCGDSLPNQCVGHPYSVRGPGGRLVRQVDGYLTPEQQKKKDEEEKRRKEEEIKRKEQARLDAALLATYASTAEIDKGAERAEAEINAAIKAAESRIATAEGKKAKAVGDPEFYKRRGMPEELRRQVQDIDFEIRTQKELVENKKKDLEATRAKFAEDRARFADLKKRQTVRN